jgi:hypothetical protein
LTDQHDHQSVDLRWRDGPVVGGDGHAMPTRSRRVAASAVEATKVYGTGVTAVRALDGVKRGLAPKGGMSFPEIGRQLGRSQYWAQLAVRSALRREEAAARGDTEFFDGSILALRKFTSSELLDAGFNISLVAQRQGHGPQVLVKHYARSRPSAERKAAEHLGQVVHGADVRTSRNTPEG